MTADGSVRRAGSSAPFVAAFVAGFASFALQVLIVRRLTPWTGTTIGAWTSVIAVVLLGTAIGNTLGGRLHRRDLGAPTRPLGIALVVAGVLTAALVPVLGAWGELLAGQDHGLLMALPALAAATALGAVYPLATRVALAGTSSPGRVLGALAAVGSLGCVVGLVASAFVFVPFVGVRLSLVATGVLLAVVGAWTLLRARSDAAGSTAPPTPLVPSLSRTRAALIATIAGAALLLVEVVAARTGGRLVGRGLATWTAVLLSVLLGATVGGFAGGRLAQRADLARTLDRLCLVAAVALLVSVWTPALLDTIAGTSGPSRPWRIALGAVLAWSPACATLSAIPPLALRMALRNDAEDARTIGRVATWQTIGCIAATVATAPLLIPVLRPAGATVLAALVLAVTPTIARRRVEIPFAVALALATAAAALSWPPAASVGRALSLRDDGDGVLVRESAYQQVRVDIPSEFAALGRPNLRRLVLDGFVHGYVDLDDPSWLGYGYEGIYAAVTERLWPVKERVETFFIGGGANTFPRYLVSRRPDTQAIVAELDPAVTDVARSSLGLVVGKGLFVADADGRTYAEAADSGEPAWDFVFGDAFDDVAVPWHLTTREFATVVAKATKWKGVYLLNVVDASGGGRFLGAVVATLRTTFAHVNVLGLGEPSGGRETFVVVSTHIPVDLSNLYRPDPRKRGETLPVVLWSAVAVDEVVRRANGLVLTDDRAPVEWLLAPVAGQAGR